MYAGIREARYEISDKPEEDVLHGGTGNTKKSRGEGIESWA